MANLNQLAYNLRDTFRSMNRHKPLTVLSIFTIAMTIFFLGAVLIILYNAHLASQQVESNLEIVAFCEPDLDHDGLNDLKAVIADLPFVEKVSFVDKETALRDLNTRFDPEVDLKTALDGENPLPDAFQVKVTAAEYIATTAKTLETISGVETVRYGQDVVKNVISLSRNMQIFTMMLIVFMVVGTLFLIHSTISLTVSRRHYEIEVMRYVGATNTYIRMPFFFEGIFIGGIGGGLAVLGLYLSYNKIYAYLSESMPFVTLAKDPTLFYLLLAGLFAVGVGLGALGSALATGKYLRK